VAVGELVLAMGHVSRLWRSCVILQLQRGERHKQPVRREEVISWRDGVISCPLGLSRGANEGVQASAGRVVGAR
jgi:hypothetical protein